jgi:hypothetical protein
MPERQAQMLGQEQKKTNLVALQVRISSCF